MDRGTAAERQQLRLRTSCPEEPEFLTDHLMNPVYSSPTTRQLEPTSKRQQRQRRLGNDTLCRVPRILSSYHPLELRDSDWQESAGVPLRRSSSDHLLS